MSPDFMRKIAKPLLFSAALIWGASFFVMKVALDVFPVFFLLALRFTLGGGALALICWKRWKHFTPDYLWRGAVLGLFLFLAYAVQTFGLTTTTPSKNAFLTAVYCVLVPFMAWIFLHQKPDRYNILAALLCVTGVALISLTEEFSIQVGDLLSLCSSFFFASHIIAVPKVSPGKDITLLTVIQFFSFAFFAWICGFCTETFPSADTILHTPGLVVSMFYLCFLSTTVALLFQNIGQVWSDPSSASVLLSLESVFGVIFSVLFYGDPVTGRLLCGFALIFVAVVCSETKFAFLRPSVRKQADM